MTKRKSIVSSFGDFREQQASDLREDTTNRVSPESPNRPAAGIVGTTQRTLTQIREERDRLLDQAASNRQVIELDPILIDASPFRDRLPDDDGVAFAEFKSSLSEEGQKVPITVRRSPADQHRYQIVYGHRRWRALKELGRDVNAIVAEYSDRDLVIAQGIENANRQDLSWIERALFANEMQSAGIKPRDIKAALGVDDTELSKFRSVLKVLPTELLEAIGRAPSIGRPRWLDLAALVKGKGDITKIKKTLAAAKDSDATSDDRFIAALGAVMPSAAQGAPTDSQLSIGLDDVGSMTMTSNVIKINLAKTHRAGFRKFLEAEMGQLLKRYKNSL